MCTFERAREAVKSSTRCQGVTSDPFLNIAVQWNVYEQYFGVPVASRAFCTLVCVCVCVCMCRCTCVHMCVTSDMCSC